MTKHIRALLFILAFACILSTGYICLNAQPIYAKTSVKQVKKAYKKFLKNKKYEKYMEDWPEYELDTRGYLIKDVDRDGMPELLIRQGSDFTYNLIFKYNSKKKKVKPIKINVYTGTWKTTLYCYGPLGISGDMLVSGGDVRNNIYYGWRIYYKIKGMKLKQNMSLSYDNVGTEGAKTYYYKNKKKISKKKYDKLMKKAEVQWLYDEYKTLAE